MNLERLKTEKYLSEHGHNMIRSLGSSKLNIPILEKNTYIILKRKSNKTLIWPTRHRNGFLSRTFSDQTQSFTSPKPRFKKQNTKKYRCRFYNGTRFARTGLLHDSIKINAINNTQPSSISNHVFIEKIKFRV